METEGAEPKRPWSGIDQTWGGAGGFALSGQAVGSGQRLEEGDVGCGNGGK